MPITRDDIEQWSHDVWMYCVEDDRYKVPQSPNYNSIRDVLGEKFEFNTLNLLHVIGNKTAPTNHTLRREDLIFRSIRYIDHIDTDSDMLRLRSLPESDFRAPFSHGLGVAVMCLLVAKVWNICWTDLAPIPGKGKRFDYRADLGNLTGIFEARGTTYRSNQRSQVKNAQDKKKSHKSRGDTADVELIIATRVGKGNENSSVLIGDPPMDFDYRAFHPKIKPFLRSRHYERACLLAGLRSAARKFRELSNLHRLPPPNKFELPYPHDNRVLYEQPTLYDTHQSTLLKYADVDGVTNVPGTDGTQVGIPHTFHLNKCQVTVHFGIDLSHAETSLYTHDSLERNTVPTTHEIPGGNLSILPDGTSLAIYR